MDFFIDANQLVLGYPCFEDFEEFLACVNALMEDIPEDIDVGDNSSGDCDINE